MRVEEFLACRFDLPESGQWAELVAGEPTFFQPPDLDHGNTVLNLSKLLAAHTSAHARHYPVFDIGLITRRDPDTVRFPAASLFDGPLFAETDNAATERLPVAVAELASTADRRRKIDERAAELLVWGVQEVWSIDPQQQTLNVSTRDSERSFRESERFASEAVADLSLCVEELFVTPDWWGG